MNFLSELVSQVGGEGAIDVINSQLTPLILNSFKPKVSEYVNSHVERTRGELYQQLPVGVQEVLDNILPGGLNKQNQRGFSDDARGFLDEIQDKIREKIDEILREISEKVRQIVTDVTSNTTGRVTDSVVDIAKDKLKLGAKREASTQSRGLNTQARAFGDNNQGDFIDNFVNSSLNEIRPLVQSELKNIYQHILKLVPQDARKILCAIVPGLEDNQDNNPNQQYNNQNQQYNNQSQEYNNQNQQYNNNQNQQFNNYQNQQYDNQNQQYNTNSSQQYNQNEQYNNNQNNSRGIEDNGTRSRGFFSDMKNLAHQVKNEFKQSGIAPLLNSSGNQRSGQNLLDEFQNKAKVKVDEITTRLMQLLEDKIMSTVGTELSTLARDKLANFKI